MKRFLTVSLIVAAVSITGCNQLRNQDVGTVVGGALGGLLGSQIGSGSGQLAATAAGALLGGLIGSNIGRSMDELDHYRANQALENTHTDYTSSWENPDSGSRYAVTPTRTYESDGTPCREYTTEAWIDGEEETLRGTACRQPDGTWRTI
jgi:surface antigen